MCSYTASIPQKHPPASTTVCSAAPPRGRLTSAGAGTDNGRADVPRASTANGVTTARARTPRMATRDMTTPQQNAESGFEFDCYNLMSYEFQTLGKGSAQRAEQSAQGLSRVLN